MPIQVLKVYQHDILLLSEKEEVLVETALARCDLIEYRTFFYDVFVLRDN